MDILRGLLPRTTLMTSTNRVAEPAIFFSIAYNAWQRGSFSELVCAAIASFANSIFLFIATWTMIFHIDWAAVRSCQLGTAGCANAEFLLASSSLASYSLFTSMLALAFVTGCGINVLFALKHLVEAHFQVREVRDVVADIVAVERHATPLHEMWESLTGTAAAAKSALDRLRTREGAGAFGGVDSNATAAAGVPVRGKNHTVTRNPERVPLATAADGNDDDGDDRGSESPDSPATGRRGDNNSNTSAIEMAERPAAAPSPRPMLSRTLEDISWSEFSHLLVKRCRKLIVHGDSFDELRLAQTIMVQDNYIIALHACNLLNGRSLRWVDESLVREILKMQFLDRRMLNAAQAFEKVSAAVYMWLIVSVVFYPVVVSFFLIKAIVRHAAEVRSQSQRLTADIFTPEARWRTRLFNELPFLADARVATARKALESVTGGASSAGAASSQLLRIPHRVAGIVISAILVVSVFSAEAAALGRFWGISGAFWFTGALMVYRWTEVRAAQAGSGGDDFGVATAAGSANGGGGDDGAAAAASAAGAGRGKSVLQQMRPVSDALLYEDVEWNLDTSTPRRCLDSLSKFYVVSRAMSAANRLFFVLAAPVFLYRLWSQKADELWPVCEFMERHSVFVNGVGSVCSFSAVPSSDPAAGGSGAGAGAGDGAVSASSSSPFAGFGPDPVRMPALDRIFGSSAPAAATATTDGAGLPTVDVSTEDFRRCRVINASAVDPYVEEASVAHKRDVSLVAFAAAHRHWADVMRERAADSHGVALVSEQLQLQSRFLAELLPPVSLMWEHAALRQSFVVNANVADRSAGRQQQQQQGAATTTTTPTTGPTSPQTYVQLFAKLRDFSEHDFLRLLLDTRAERLLSTTLAETMQRTVHQQQAATRR